MMNLLNISTIVILATMLPSMLNALKKQLQFRYATTEPGLLQICLFIIIFSTGYALLDSHIILGYANAADVLLFLCAVLLAVSPSVGNTNV